MAGGGIALMAQGASLWAEGNATLAEEEARAKGKSGGSGGDLNIPTLGDLSSVGDMGGKSFGSDIKWRNPWWEHRVEFPSISGGGTGGGGDGGMSGGFGGGGF